MRQKNKISNVFFKDWGEVSEVFEKIKQDSYNKDLSRASEAQTRFDIIDRMIKDVLQWSHGQIHVEERDSDSENQRDRVDYILRSGDTTIIIEAKKIGASFPSPTKQRKLKITGTVLGVGEINAALQQVEGYALSKKGNYVIATNGSCWCFYPFSEKLQLERTDLYATILFPFQNTDDAEELFNLFACHNVESNSLSDLSFDKLSYHENRILQIVKDSDARIDRNNIADHIGPALDHALHSESILNDSDKLAMCFVSTEGRTKYDSILKMHLADVKPITIQPAKKIRRDKDIGEINNLVKQKPYLSAPPVTLIIGSVGAGKSTYLKHFELIKGKKLITQEKCHWIYIDFEEMGEGGSPRTFIYNKLNKYLLDDHPDKSTDYRNAVEPAYKEEIDALARGPYGGIFSNKDKFNEKVNEIIHSDYIKVEPYVDKVYKYIAANSLCVIVLDNIDLYENEELETTLFSEAISISKKIRATILVSIRDTTFVKHRNDSIFNAYELKKLWLDPPPFREVLSKRLSLSRKILENKRAEISLSKGLRLEVPDLGLFFDIVKSSILTDENGKFLESLSDRNIRRGISLVRNFLTSGHIQADRAIKNYIHGDATYKFPYHEVFKGSILGQWKYYKEERADAINIFDSGYHNKNLQLLRFLILKYLHFFAQDQRTIEVESSSVIEKFSSLAASPNIIINCLAFLKKNGLINDKMADEVSPSSSIFLTLAGGYYVVKLSHDFAYLEAVLHDTVIFDKKVWEDLKTLTLQIEAERNIYERLKIRQTRIMAFIEYLRQLEDDCLINFPDRETYKAIDSIEASVKFTTNYALMRSKNYEYE